MEAHAMNSRKEIDYDVVRRFGKTKDSETKEKLSRTKFHHLGEEDISADPKEIEYETTNKFNPSRKGAETKIGEEIEYDTINKFNPSQKQAARRESENANAENENTEHEDQNVERENENAEDNTNEMDESGYNKTMSANWKGKERKGKKVMNSELMESHLQKQAMTPMRETNSPVKVLAHMEANINRKSF